MIDNPVLEMKNITKSYNGVKALDNISFKVEGGSILGILGPNGAGKTTTMRICSTLLPTDSGDVFYSGMNLNGNMKKIRKKISLMPQGPALDPMLKVKDNLILACKLKNINTNDHAKILDELIDLFGLDKFVNKNIMALSGGQFRRVQLARTFIGNPELIFLDEPTLGIDIQGKLTIWKTIKEYVKKNNTTILIASNDITEIEKTCKYVMFINEGLLLFDSLLSSINFENKISIKCTLKETCPPDYISLSNNGDLTIQYEKENVTITCKEYTTDVVGIISELTKKFGLLNITEEKASLTDLFDKYGGKN